MLIQALWDHCDGALDTVLFLPSVVLNWSIRVNGGTGKRGWQHQCVVMFSGASLSFVTNSHFHIAQIHKTCGFVKNMWTDMTPCPQDCSNPKIISFSHDQIFTFFVNWWKCEIIVPQMNLFLLAQIHHLGSCNSKWSQWWWSGSESIILSARRHVAKVWNGVLTFCHGRGCTHGHQALSIGSEKSDIPT